MRNIPKTEHLAGILGLVHDPCSKRVEFIWAHSTATMCIGYMSASNSSGKSFVSVMPENCPPGTTVIAQSKMYKYK